MHFAQNLYVLVVNLAINVNGVQYRQRIWTRTIPRKLL